MSKIQTYIRNIGDLRAQRALRSLFSKFLNDDDPTTFKSISFGSSDTCDIGEGNLKLSSTPITATAAELNKVDGIAGPALAGEAIGDRVEFGREAFTNSGTAAADIAVTVTFAADFTSAPVVTLGKECTEDARISTAASTSGFSMTVASVPASTTVHVNWTAVGK